MREFNVFEDWMLAHPIKWNGKTGKVDGRVAGTKAGVWIKWDDTSADSWIELRKLEFITPPQQQTQKEIVWEVGQKVFCLLYGEGVVHSVDDSRNHYPIEVEYEDTFNNYTRDGKLFDGHKNRSLFFSDPKVTAECFPPKKPFEPTLKHGDKVLIEFQDGGWLVTTIAAEDEEEVYFLNQVSGTHYFKDGLRFYKIGEEIEVRREINVD